jgi:hypothetical protein
MALGPTPFELRAKAESRQTLDESISPRTRIELSGHRLKRLEVGNVLNKKTSLSIGPLGLTNWLFDFATGVQKRYSKMQHTSWEPNWQLGSQLAA